MSTLKLILLVVGAGGALFIALVVYSLSPTVRNASREAVLAPYVGKSIKLKRRAFLHKRDKGMYDLVENVITEIDDNPGELLLEIPEGAEIKVNEFKTYTNNLGSGFTWIYALGEVTGKDGNEIPFEYALGTVDKKLYSDQPRQLGLTIWQDEFDRPIVFIKK
ncbi:MAG: hypothetical protein ABIS36_08640 [Chryseolinea sp.]